jgi:hypothetical protein
MPKIFDNIFLTKINPCFEIRKIEKKLESNNKKEIQSKKVLRSST